MYRKFALGMVGFTLLFAMFADNFMPADSAQSQTAMVDTGKAEINTDTIQPAASQPENIQESFTEFDASFGQPVDSAAPMLEAEGFDTTGVQHDEKSRDIDMVLRPATKRPVPQAPAQIREKTSVSDQETSKGGPNAVSQYIFLDAAKEDR